MFDHASGFSMPNYVYYQLESSGDVNMPHNT